MKKQPRSVVPRRRKPIKRRRGAWKSFNDAIDTGFLGPKFPKGGLREWLGRNLFRYRREWQFQPQPDRRHDKYLHSAARARRREIS